MASIHRRRFLSRSAQCAAGAAMSAASYARVAGANDRVRLGLIGCGGRGRGLMSGFAGRDDVEVTWLCDAIGGKTTSAAKTLAKVQKTAPKLTQDLRRVLDGRGFVDAVIVATPDHWHALATVLACQAGKDVFVEKPASHNIWGGRKMVEAARKYKRIVQVGMQNRSAPYNVAAREYIADGKLGEIHLVKVYNLKSGGSIRIGKPAPDEKPKDFDWDRWLGPVALRPFTPGLVRRWYYFWDFCGGDMGNDSIHQLDLARMLLGDPPTPTRVSCSGGRLHHKDDADVPDTQVVTFDYPGMVMTFENTQYPPYMAKTPFSIRQSDTFPHWPLNATRIELYGSKAQMVMGRHGGGWQVFGKAGKVIDQRYGRFPDPPHQANWIECIKSRKLPTADIAIGHDSALLVHLGNIALRTGNQKLTFDSKAEKFVSNPAANKLVKRDYRQGYEIPDKV